MDIRRQANAAYEARDSAQAQMVRVLNEGSSEKMLRIFDR